MERGAEEILNDQARQKFGDSRAEELKPEIQTLVADLQAIDGHPITVEDAL
jgi:hypothetical protein